MNTPPSFNYPAYQAVLEPQSAPSQSTLTLVLPPVIRNRLPTIPSIRRRYTKPLENTAPQQSESRPSSSSSAEGELVSYSPGEVAQNSTRSSRSSSNTSSGTATPHVARASGVNWSLAGAGVRLWLTGRQQLEDDPTADPQMMRSMHIDALKYMHAALPNDLTPTEVDTVVGSLPKRVRDDLKYRPHGVAVPHYGIAENNILRNGVSNLVCMLMALLIFLLPFFIASLNRLLRYEREHRLSERVLSNSAAMANALAERGLDLKSSRAGSAMLGAIVWTVDGIVGGVNDGMIRSTSHGRGRQAGRIQYLTEK